MAHRSDFTRAVALGGIFAALAVVVMCMGGLIPVATFVCPVICMMMLAMVRRRCGKRIAWAWYGAVAILSLLLGPDKEAAAIFAVLGYYPMIKRWLDKKPFALVWKLLFFNICIGALYFVLLRLFGLSELSQDYAIMGTWVTVIMLVMGNVTFYLLDQLLSIRFKVRKRREQP